MADTSFPEGAAEVAPLLVVADLQRSLYFYVEQLGARTETVWDTYAELRLGAGRLHLATPSSGTYDKPGISLIPPPDRYQLTGEVVLHVADCRQVYLDLVSRGINFLEPPSEPPWGGEIRCFFQDPDGHLIEVSQTE
ncbi:MAG: VOC family protein [Actinomycetota bacterium]|nr:VOC family protein [Actinomycetota bacterium]